MAAVLEVGSWKLETMSSTEKRLLELMSAVEHKAKIRRSKLTHDITEACRILLEYVAETREFKLAALAGVEQSESTDAELSHFECAPLQCYSSA